MSNARVLGIVGWSGSGKTTLIKRLLPLLTARGLRVATLKHAHHRFDVDRPGKDSFEHRKAGACEVIVSSAQRWVQIHEIADGAEAALPELLEKVSPCDLILVEGFKSGRHPKVEAFRAAAGNPALHPHDRHILAIASDRAFPEAGIPVVDLNDARAVAELVLQRALPLAAVLEALNAPTPP